MTVIIVYFMEEAVLISHLFTAFLCFIFLLLGSLLHNGIGKGSILWYWREQETGLESEEAKDESWKNQHMSQGLTAHGMIPS